MSIFNWGRNKFRRKDQQPINGSAVSMIGVQPGFRATWKNYDYDSYISDGYCGNPYLFGAIDIIQRNISAVPILIQERRGNEIVDIPEDDPIVKLINNPSEIYSSWQDWISAMIVPYLLAGESYALAMSPNATGTGTLEPPVYLHPVSPNRVRCLPLLDAVSKMEIVGFIRGFEFNNGQKKILMSKDDIFYFKNFNPVTDYEGLSVCKPGEKTIDTNNSCQNYNKAILDNGGFVGTVMVAEDPMMNENAIRKMKNMFDEEYGGARRAGKTYWAWGGIKPHKIGLSPTEMGFKDLSDLTARQIAVIFRIPPQLIGDTSAQTYANYAEARVALYLECILPLCEALLRNLQNFLSRRFSRNIRLNIDLDSITALAALRRENNTSTIEAYRAGLITRTEARVALNWSAKDDGGEFVSDTTPMILQAEGKSWALNKKSVRHNHKGEIL